MPQELADADDAIPPEWGNGASGRGDAQSGHWWCPASYFGRAFLTLGALLVLGGLTVSALMLRTYLQRDSRFRIAGSANIQATGLTQVSRADMLQVFGEDIGKNIFFVHLDERRRQLEAIPWVQHATVMRVLPDQLRVSLVERTPVAFTQIGQETGLVDADGVLLTMSAATMAEHHYSFPVVTGIDPADKPEARKARMAVYMRLMAELDANGQKNSEQISEIDLSDPEDARVQMPEQGADIVAHFGEDRFLERYQRYMKHIAEWRQQYPRLIGVDLRYDRQAVLQMAPAGAPMPGDPAPGAQTAQAGNPGNAQATAQPAQPAKTAASTTPPSPQHVKSAPKPKAGSGAGSRMANTRAAGTRAERGRIEKAKAEKLRKEKARTEKIRLEQQKKHNAARRPALNTAQHTPAPAPRPVSTVVEGQ
jgi:cell division protein FtsQ